MIRAILSYSRPFLAVLLVAYVTYIYLDNAHSDGSKVRYIELTTILLYCLYFSIFNVSIFFIKGIEILEGALVLDLLERLLPNSSHQAKSRHCI